MKTRLCKFLLALCLLPLFASASSIAFAQDQAGQFPNQGLPRRFGGMGFNSIDTNIVRFDVEIANGELSLAPLKGRVDANEFNMGPGAQPAPEDIHSVPATIANLAAYLRAADTNVNITVAPSATEVQIKDLKLHAADVSEVVSAVGVATDGAVSATPLFNRGGNSDFAFSATQVNLPQNPTRTVEVFNINGFIKSLNLTQPPPEAVIRRRLDEVENLISDTLKALYPNNEKQSVPFDFRFHSGTGLLIVIGTPETIEVARKIINALPGQSAAELKQFQQALDTSPGSQQK